MKALYDFIVEPLGERYANKIKIGDKELVLNTNIENHKFVNSIAKVLATPVNIETKVSKGNILLVHHNVFRRFPVTIIRHEHLIHRNKIFIFFKIGSRIFFIASNIIETSKYIMMN